MGRSKRNNQQARLRRRRTRALVTHHTSSSKRNDNRSQSSGAKSRKGKIMRLLDQTPIPMEELRTYAAESHHNGLASAAVRRRVWPLFLGVDIDRIPDYWSVNSSELTHKELSQVDLDVKRSLYTLVNDTELQRSQRESLSFMINSVLSRRPNLHYCQGYHDVASVLLLVCGERSGLAMLERMSLFHIRETLRTDLTQTREMLKMIFPLVRLSGDTELADFIERSGVDPFFALSWVMTWFSHDVANIDKLCVIWDLLLVSHPFMCLYISAAILLDLRHTILSSECDYAMVHSRLQRLPQDYDFRPALCVAQKLIVRVTPKRLLRVSRASLPWRSPLHDYPWPWYEETQQCHCLGSQSSSKEGRAVVLAAQDYATTTRREKQRRVALAAALTVSVSISVLLVAAARSWIDVFSRTE